MAAKAPLRGVRKAFPALWAGADGVSPHSANARVEVIVAGEDPPLPQRHASPGLIDARNHLPPRKPLLDRGWRFFLGAIADVKRGSAAERVVPLLLGIDQVRPFLPGRKVDDFVVARPERELVLEIGLRWNINRRMASCFDALFRKIKADDRRDFMLVGDEECFLAKLLFDPPSHRRDLLGRGTPAA